MIWDLLALQWAAVGGCALMGCMVAGSFVAEVVREARRAPAPAWRPSGEWVPRTPRHAKAWDVWPLVIGSTPEQVEDEIRRMIETIPDRPA